MTTTPPDGLPVPVRVRVVLPDGQELTARLWPGGRRRAAGCTRWGCPAYRNTENAMNCI
jgi:hypothetical protein